MGHFYPIVWLALVFGPNSLNIGMICTFSLAGPIQNFKLRELCQLSLDQSLIIATISMCPFVWTQGKYIRKLHGVIANVAISTNAVNITDGLEKISHCFNNSTNNFWFNSYSKVRIYFTVPICKIPICTEVELQLYTFLKKIHWQEDCLNELAMERNRHWIISYFTERDK